MFRSEELLQLHIEILYKEGKKHDYKYCVSYNKKSFTEDRAFL